MKVERGGFRGRLSAFLQKATGWGPKKAPGVSKREGCVRPLARAITRANRAAAKRPPAHAHARSRETRAKQGHSVPPFAWKEARMTVNDPRPQLAAALAARLAPEYRAWCRREEREGEGEAEAAPHDKT